MIETNNCMLNDIINLWWIYNGMPTVLQVYLMLLVGIYFVRSMIHAQFQTIGCA